MSYLPSFIIVLLLIFLINLISPLIMSTVLAECPSSMSDYDKRLLKDCSILSNQEQKEYCEKYRHCFEGNEKKDTLYMFISFKNYVVDSIKRAFIKVKDTVLQFKKSNLEF